MQERSESLRQATSPTKKKKKFLAKLARNSKGISLARQTSSLKSLLLPLQVVFELSEEPSVDSTLR